MESDYNDIYKRAYQASLRVHYLLDGNDDLSEQAKRASRSVAASIAVAESPATSFDDGFVYFEEAVRESVELTVWLDFCKDLDRLDAQAAQSLKEEYTAIIEQLSQSLTLDLEDFEDEEDSES